MRRVSATWASVASAGWQQVKISSSRSSGKAVSSSSSSTACRHLQQLRLVGERPLAADAVDRPVAGGGDQPGSRVRRRAVARPALGGDRERLLGGLLGEVEVAEEADQGGEDAAPLLAEDLLESAPLTTGRTSIAAAHAGGRDLRRQLDRGVEVVGLEEEVAAKRLLGLDEGPVGGQRLAVLRPAPWSPSQAAASGRPDSTPGVSLIAW